MSFTPANPVTSSQAGVHNNLEKVVRKHCSSQSQRPIANHNQEAFNLAYHWWTSKGCPKVILDSACGTGESSRHLASMHDDHCVIGLDQSEKRLNHQDNVVLPDNCLLLRCDCTDFWRLAQRKQSCFDQHTLLYPNPYPKPQHLQRRWHGDAALPSLLAISRHIELRTNWKVYAQEFYLALGIAGALEGMATLQEYRPVRTMTAFERKYLQSGHQLWCVHYNDKALVPTS